MGTPVYAKQPVTRAALMWCVHSSASPRAQSSSSSACGGEGPPPGNGFPIPEQQKLLLSPKANLDASVWLLTCFLMSAFTPLEIPEIQRDFLSGTTHRSECKFSVAYKHDFFQTASVCKYCAAQYELVYLCLCMHLCMYVSVCMYSCMYEKVCVCFMRECACLRVFLLVYVFMYACICVYVFMDVYGSVCLCFNLKLQATFIAS